jgi:hypothetical protein
MENPIFAGSLLWGVLLGGLGAFLAKRKGNNGVVAFLIVFGIIVGACASSFLFSGSAEVTVGDRIVGGVIFLGFIVAIGVLVFYGTRPYRCLTCGKPLSRQQYVERNYCDDHSTILTP